MAISRQKFLRLLGMGALVSGMPAPPPALLKATAEARRLKIRAIEIYAYNIPLFKPFRIAIGTMTAANNLLVRVHTDAGVMGIGEGCPFPPITGDTQATALAAARALRETLLNKDALAIESRLADCRVFLHTNPATVAAFDMALYDILGKVAGLPLFRLLGGEGAPFATSITVDLDTPEKMAEMAREYLNQGYRVLKVKVGQAPELDVSRVQAVRQTAGAAVPIRIDANQGWTPAQAVSALRRMEGLNVEFAEQPVVAWDIDGLAAVRRQVSIPLMADEAVFSPYDAMRLVRADACDYFNIKLTKCGGIFTGLKIAHVAEAANRRCMVGCMIDSRLALTAAAHLRGAAASIEFADLDGNSEHDLDPVLGGIEVKAGMITLPEQPGLGLDIDPKFLNRLQRF